MLFAFLSVFRRDLLLAGRSPGARAAPALFFVAAVAVFPLGASPNPEILRQAAPAVVWTAALLAALLSQEALFRDDRDDGALEQALLSPQPVALFVLAKSAAHFAAVGLPLLALSPLLGIMLGLSVAAALVLAAAMIPGVAVFSLFGAFASALTLGIPRGGMLPALLVLPLCAPALIFAAAAVSAADNGAPFGAHFSLLCALLALALALLPAATAGALRAAVSAD